MNPMHASAKFPWAFLTAVFVLASVADLPGQHASLRWLPLAVLSAFATLDAIVNGT